MQRLAEPFQAKRKQLGVTKQPQNTDFLPQADIAAGAPAAPRPESIAAPFAALVVGALAMGVSPIFVRLADVGPFTSAFWRVALALPALYAWMRLSERGRGKPAASFSRATIWAGIAFAGDLFFWHLSIVTTSVANATFFATTAPIWVVLFGWLIFRTRASAAILAGLGLCIVGGAALLAQSFQMQGGHALGDFFGLITGVFFGLYFLAVQAARQGSSAARVTFEATTITAALLLAVALILERQLLPQTIGGVAALLALAWISHAGGQGLLSVALGRLPAAFSSLVIFLEAIAAACFAWALLGEPVTLIQAGGGLAILAGIYVARPR
jgi:drug/metabolite transporter (DMT)-like permease